MKSILAFSLTVSTFFFVSTFADEDIGLCCLCDDCKPVVRGREALTVDNKGKTCNALYMDLADPTNASKMGNALCLDQIGRFRSRCCDAKHIPVEIVQAPTPAPNFGITEGTEPICNICRDGSYPTQPFARIVTFDRFIKGEKTCDELYRMGLTGNIPDQICNSLVNYAQRPCGCTSNNQVLRSPTSSPTQVPAPFPTQMPVTSPSTSPSLAPITVPTYNDGSGESNTLWKKIEKRMSKHFNREKRRLRGRN